LLECLRAAKLESWRAGKLENHERNRSGQTNQKARLIFVSSFVLAPQTSRRSQAAAMATKLQWTASLWGVWLELPKWTLGELEAQSSATARPLDTVSGARLQSD